MDPLQSEAALKEYLRNCNKARRGSFGEKLFVHLEHKNNAEVQPFRREGADFIVTGLGRVDVKTRRKLDAQSGGKYSRISEKERLHDTSYCYVVLWENEILIEMVSVHPGKSYSCNLTWLDALECWNSNPENKLKPPRTAFSEKVSIIRRELGSWILLNWKRKAKIVYCNGRRYQDQYSARGWGPDSFYQDPLSKRKVDLVVLLYFDEGEVYEVFAYPMNQAEIIWDDKFVGPNPTGKKTFKPLALATKFKFSGIEDFKNAFPQRFYKHPPINPDKKPDVESSG